MKKKTVMKNQTKTYQTKKWRSDEKKLKTWLARMQNSHGKVKTNARVRGKASQVDDEAMLHTCIPSIFPWTKSATPRNPPEERRRQLAVALLRNTGEKPRARSTSTHLPFFPGRRLSGWRRWLCSEWYRPSGDRCRPPKKWKLIQVWRVRVGVKLSCRGRRIFHGSEKKKKTRKRTGEWKHWNGKDLPAMCDKNVPAKTMKTLATQRVSICTRKMTYSQMPHCAAENSIVCFGASIRCHAISLR